MGGISRLLDFFFSGGESYSEDGARCYGVSAEIQSVMLLKKFCSCQFAVFLSDSLVNTPHTVLLYVLVWG